MGGDLENIDTGLEALLTLYYTPGIVAIHPPEAARILPQNNRTSGLRLASAVLYELTEVKFLTPQDTAAVGRYEGMVRFIQDRHGLTRAEIDNYYRDALRAELIRIGNQYTLICDGFWGTPKVSEIREFSSSSLVSFYVNPSEDNYNTLVGIAARTLNNALTGNVAYHANAAFHQVLRAVLSELATRISRQITEGMGRNLLTLSRFPADPRFNVFNTR